MKYHSKKTIKIALTVVITIGLITTGVLLWGNKDAPTATAGWWNDSWNYRKAITVNHDYVAGDLTDFPMLVSLTDASLGTHAQEDGDDIVFIDSEGKKLSHEIESFATTTGVLVAWVKIPQLSSTEDTDIYMYYGNAGVGSQQDAVNTWDENFKAVWHMNSETTASTTDSTGNCPDGTKYDSVLATSSGKINGAQKFSAGTDMIKIGTSTALDNLQYKTIEAWIKVPDQGGHSAIIEKIDEADNDPGWFLSLRSDEQVAYRHRFTNAVAWWEYDTSLTIGEWYYVAITYDYSSTSPFIYINANTVAINEVGAKDGDHSDDSSEGVNIGNTDSGNADFEGVLDELRVSNTIRSAEWIETSFNNQNSPSDFLSAQAEETGPGPIGYWSFDTGYGTTAEDSSANNNDGTITGATWQDESMCVSGKCLYFDGSGDYVDISAEPAIQAASDSKLTFSIWAKPLDINSAQVIMSATNENGFGDTETVGELNLMSENIGWKIEEQAGLQYKIATTTTWRFLTGVFDGTNWYLYVDGVLRAEQVNGVDLSGLTPLSLHIGRPHTDERYFNGFLDEVKIYPYARTAAQIQQDYNAGLAGVSSNSGVAASFGGSSDKWMTDGLVGYWKFDEAATTSGAIDSSGNGNDGTYYGDASTTAGKFGQGGKFGDHNSGDYVNFGSDSSLNTYGSDYTVAAWVNLDDYNASYTSSIFTRFSESGGLEFKIGGYSSDTGKIGIKHWSVTDPNVVSNNVVSIGTWHHIAATYDISSQKVNFYLDGVHDSERIIQAHDNLDGNAYTSIDARDETGFEINGKLDELRLYKRVFSPDEVRKLYEWAPGPVAHWKFDEMSGTTAYDSAASTTFSGGNHGALGAGSNQPAWTQLGKYGGALYFDGNDYVNLGQPPSLNITGGMTVSAWIYQTTLTDYNYIASKGASSGQRGWGLRCSDSGTFCQFNIARDTDTEVGTPGSVSGVSETGKWMHLTGVYDPSNALLLYKNGVLVESNTTDIPAVQYNQAVNASIGSRTNLALYMRGYIDDVRIYNYARTPKQILADMAGGSHSAGSSAGQAVKFPVLHLSFDEGYGAVAYDKSIYENNGALQPGDSGGNTASSSMWDKNGKLGGAMEFDGTDDYIEITDDDSIDADSSVSVSAWFKGDTLSGTDTIIFKYINYFLQAVDVNIYFGVYSEGWYPYVTSSINTDQWYHVVGVFDDEANKDILYLNGEKVDEVIETGAISGSGDPLYIGRTDNGEYFDGLVDEVKIYNYALSEDEVKSEYNFGRAAVMGSPDISTATSGALATYCVPGATDYCMPPVLELKFDELSGTTTYDTSGNGNDGVFTTADTSPSWELIGKKGSALEFDGDDDRVVIGNVSELDLVDNFTVSAWIKPTTVGTNQYIYTNGSTDQNYWAMIIYSNKLTFTEDDGGSTYSSDSNLTANTWTHVTITKNGDGADNISFYLNGISDGTDSAGTTQSQGVKAIGYRPEGSDFEFSGLIDDVRIYDYARTGAQIAWDYNRGKPVGYWKFDECSGGTIHDASGNGNNGTLYLGTTGVTATGTCASSSNSFWYNGRDGKINSAGSFDGLSGCVSLGTTNIPTTNQAKTVSAWVKTSTVENNQAYDDNVSLLGTDASGYFKARVRGATETVTNRFIADNTWHHLAASWDGSAVKNIYLDGEPVWTGTESSGGAVTTPRIGSIYSCGGAQLWNGLVDEVKVFNYALTPEQVRVEYAGGAVKFGQ